MIEFERRSEMGDTVGEYLESLLLEIDGDGEGLWAIVSAGANFNCRGKELSEFVGLCVLFLLKRGAVPVRHAEAGTMRWEEQTQYGTTRGVIADAIVAEWLESGGGDPPWEYLWFVTRRVLETAKRV